MLVENLSLEPLTKKRKGGKTERKTPSISSKKQRNKTKLWAGVAPSPRGATSSKKRATNAGETQVYVCGCVCVCAATFECLHNGHDFSLFTLASYINIHTYSLTCKKIGKWRKSSLEKNRRIEFHYKKKKEFFKRLPLRVCLFKYFTYSRLYIQLLKS